MKPLVLTTIATAALTVSGCGTNGLDLLDRVGAAGPKAAEYVAKIEDATLGNAMTGVGKYCTVPPAVREALRQRLNSRPEGEGAQVAVWCPGDPTTLLPASLN